MKAEQKLLILCFLFLIIILPSCLSNVHEPSAGYSADHPKIKIEEATDSIKKAVKGTIPDPLQGYVKRVSDVIVADDSITLINSDGTRRYYTLNELREPIVVYDHIFNRYAVDLTSFPHYILFDNSESAKLFADSLYYLKHTDIKQAREKEREDSLRRVQQTVADEQKEREKKHEESLRLIRKTAVQEEAGATVDETIPDSTTKKRRSQPRPASPKKSAVELPQRQPEGGAPPLPALPAGGAVSGN